MKATSKSEGVQPQSVRCTYKDCTNEATEVILLPGGQVDWACCDVHQRANRPTIIQDDGKELTASEALLREVIAGAVDARYELLRQLVVREIADDVIAAIKVSPEVKRTVERVVLERAEGK